MHMRAQLLTNSLYAVFIIYLVYFRYGDISPRSFPGRIVAMIWTLIGLVLVGILTGALTSTITTLTIPPTPNLYDTNVSRR